MSWPELQELWVAGVVALFVIGLAIVVRRLRHGDSAAQILIELGAPDSRRVAFAGGIASALVPGSFQVEPQSDGSLTLDRYDVNGASITLSACLMEVVHPEHDPVYAVMEGWADEHGGALDIGPDRIVARARTSVEESGETCATYAWLVGRPGVLVSIVLEVQQRKVRPRTVKSLLRDVEQHILEGVATNVTHHALASGFGPVHYPAIGTLGVSLRTLRTRDRDFLETWANAATAICQRYFSSLMCTHVTPSHLDMLLDLWRMDTDPARPPATDLEKAIGAMLGVQCAQQLEMDWAATVVDDRRHLVVFHRPSGVMFFPFKAAGEALLGADPLLGALAGATEQQIELRQQDRAEAA